MAQHGDELFAQFGALALGEEQGLAGGQPVMGVEMKGDQLGEQFEHARGFRRLQPGRARIDGAERAEESAVRQHDGHRDVTLETIQCGRVVPGELGVLRDMVDHHALAAVPDLVADGGFNFQLAAGDQPESDLVAHAAGDPAVLGDPGDRREAHAGAAADHFQDCGNRTDAGDRVQIGLIVVRHKTLDCTIRHENRAVSLAYRVWAREANRRESLI